MYKWCAVFFVTLTSCTAPSATDFIVRPIRGDEIPEGFTFTQLPSGDLVVKDNKPTQDPVKIYFNSFTNDAVDDGVPAAFQTAIDVWNNHPCVSDSFFTFGGQMPLGELNPSMACRYQPDGVLVSYITEEWKNFPGDGDWADVLGCAVICLATGKTHHVFINASGGEKRHHFSPPDRPPYRLAGEYSSYEIAVHELGHVLAERENGNNEHITEKATNVMDARLKRGKAFTGFTKEDDRWICNQFGK